MAVSGCYLIKETIGVRESIVNTWTFVNTQPVTVINGPMTCYSSSLKYKLQKKKILFFNFLKVINLMTYE